jgi:hypothetical protein
VRCFVGKISRTLSLTRDSPASLPDGSGCWIRVIRMSVLRRQASHLLLIRTNSGYVSVLTAACVRWGCSASDLVFYYLLSRMSRFCPQGHKLINNILNMEELPVHSMESIIVPIYKKGYGTDCCNYRRTQLLWIIYKVIPQFRQTIISFP